MPDIANINFFGEWVGTEQPVQLSADLGSNIWILGVVEGSYVKMVEVEITGKDSWNVIMNFK